MDKGSFKKVLIIRLSALGDTIHTLPLAAALKKQYPDIQLDWIVEDKASKFIINNPLIDNSYELKRNKQGKIKDKLRNFIEYILTIRKIRKEKYDIVIDTQQLLKSAVILGLSGGKRKITLDNGREFSGFFANEIIKTGRKQFDINFHVVKRTLEIAKYLGCKDIEPKFVLPDLSKEYSQYIKEIINNLDKSKKTIILAPVTTWENKHWTIEGWNCIINEFKNEYNIIITAAETEKKYIDTILKNIPDKNKIINLAGLTTLSDLVLIYKHADIIISPDSGSLHIGWAIQSPYIVSLFFATSAKRTAPYGDKYYSVSADLQCSPCMKKKCRKKDNLNMCRTKIQPQKIINIVKKVLQQN